MDFTSAKARVKAKDEVHHRHKKDLERGIEMMTMGASHVAKAITSMNHGKFRSKATTSGTTPAVCGVSASTPLPHSVSSPSSLTSSSLSSFSASSGSKSRVAYHAIVVHNS